VTFTLQELAALSGGELVGDSTLNITGAASLGEATQGEISFFTNRKYIGLLRKTRASAIFVPADFAETVNAAQIRVSNPTKAFEQVVLKFAPKPITFAPGAHPTAPMTGSSIMTGRDGRVSQPRQCRPKRGRSAGVGRHRRGASDVGHETHWATRPPQGR